MNTALGKRKKESWKIFNEIAPTYDLLNHLLSMGIDIHWRKKLLKNLPNTEEMNVLDLATGTGDVALVLAKSPNIKEITGMDLSEGMVNIGKQKVSKRKLAYKIKMEIGDGCQIPKENSIFNAVTLSFGIRNFPAPQKGLDEIYRVLVPGGRALIMEFGLPSNIFVKAVYLFYFRYLLPFIGNLISNHKDAYKYLNETVEDFPFGEDFANWMKEAGFNNVKVIPLSFGIANLYIGDK